MGMSVRWALVKARATSLARYVVSAKQVVINLTSTGPSPKPSGPRDKFNNITSAHVSSISDPMSVSSIISVGVLLGFLCVFASSIFFELTKQLFLEEKTERKAKWKRVVGRRNLHEVRWLNRLQPRSMDHQKVAYYDLPKSITGRETERLTWARNDN